jgi:hypothetical protein
MKTYQSGSPRDIFPPQTPRQLEGNLRQGGVWCAAETENEKSLDTCVKDVTWDFA